MKQRIVPLVATIIWFIGACAEPTTPSRSQPASFDRQNISQAGLYGIEREFQDISDSVPEFAGMYYNAAGALIVSIVDATPDRLSKITRQLERRGHQVGSAVSRSADYSFSQLVDWRQRMRPVLPSGVYSVDLDEVANRLSFGVSDMRLSGTLRSLGASLGIPPNALDVVKAAAPSTRSTLQDKQRPLRGGVQITWNQTNAFCTILISGLSPSLRSGYYTNDHCSVVPAGPDNNTSYFQPVYQLFNLVGGEANDPAAFSGGSCAAGRVCRNADILFIDGGGATTGANTIFKPTGNPAIGADGSITIAGTFTVASGPPAMIGDTIQKVGRSSGWTKGVLQSTCVDKFTGLFKGSAQLWNLCNDISTVWSRPGDSGSPIFKTAGNNVQLLGILWGGPSNNFNETWHSPCANIAQDLPFYQVYC